MQLPQTVKELMGSPALVHMATVDPDGKPHVTCAWAGLEGDDIVIGTLFDQRKLKNIRRDPRVTLSIQTNDSNEVGMNHYLVIYGRARVTEGGAPELLQELAEIYIGPGVKFPPMPNPPAGFVTHITAEKIRGLGPWA